MQSRASGGAGKQLFAIFYWIWEYVSSDVMKTALLQRMLFYEKMQQSPRTCEMDAPEIFEADFLDSHHDSA